MTLRHMKIFLAVYQTENITRAAKQLSMTQPAVSRAVQEIEQYYGIRLFERINRRLHVTQTGKLFYSYALHIVGSFDEMERGLRNWDELGILRVGTSVTVGNSLLPQVLRQFKARHPELQVRATVCNGTKLRQALLDDQMDFAVMEGSVHEEALCKQELATDRLVLLLPPEDPRLERDVLRLQDFAKDPLLLREEGSMCRGLVSRVFEAHGMPAEPVLESASTQALVRAVHAGLGISFLPEQLVRWAIDTGFVATRELEDEQFQTRNFIVWHRQKFLTCSARELMETFRAASDRKKLDNAP